MKFKKIEVKERIFGEEENVKVNLKLESKHILYSEKNSKGKTTLIRFIIYSLGFKIPSTKKVDMRKYITVLTIETDDGKTMCLRRNNSEFIIYFEDGTDVVYNLDDKSEHCKALSMVFQCNRVDLLENMLPIFYVDQDKGWRLVNRGTVIGENSFNIENFILALNNDMEENIAAEIRALDAEIKRYEAIQCLMAYELDSNSSKDIYSQSDIVDELLIEKGIKRFEISDKEKEISNLKAIFKDNNNLLDFIERYNLLIKYNDMEFVLEREHIKDFTINQNILQARINSLEVEKKFIERELAELEREISEANVLVKIEHIEDIVAREVHNLPITEAKLDDFITKKKKELNELKAVRKEIVRYGNSGIAEYLANNIMIIAKKLDVSDIIATEKDYVFTRNIKALSGAILHKISLIYKITYLKAIEKFIGLKLPVIIDSPCSGEVTLDNAKEMIKIVAEELPEHQIIIASIHKFEELDFKKTKLIEGVFGEYRNER